MDAVATTFISIVAVRVSHSNFRLGAKILARRSVETESDSDPECCVATARWCRVDAALEKRAQ